MLKDNYAVSSKMKVLILGSSGVVGKALHTLLESQGHDVIPWDISISPDHDLAREFSLPPCDFVFFLAYNVGGSKYAYRCINTCVVCYNIFNVAQVPLRYPAGLHQQQRGHHEKYLWGTATHQDPLRLRIVTNV